MVRKKIILKDAFRLIKFNLKQFVSLLLIIIFASSVYVGLKTLKKDMVLTATNYYDKTNFMDLKINSDVVFLQYDDTCFKKINLVNGISMRKTLNAKTKINDKDYNLKLNSISLNRSIKSYDYINRLTLTNGKYPSTINEGLVEEDFLKKTGLKINDLMTINEEENLIKAKKIKIVGTVKSDYYSDSSKDGSYYVYLENNEFNFDYYNEVLITLNKSNKIKTFDKNYESLVKDAKSKISIEANKIIESRKQQKVQEEQAKIENAQTALDNLYQSDNEQNSLTEEIKEENNNLKMLKNNLEKLKSSNVLVKSRLETDNFLNYKKELNKIDNLNSILPLVIFITLLLTVVLYVNGMIKKDKKQIGLLKIEGCTFFSIFSKYLLYALLLAIIGSLLGSLIFYKLLSKIINIPYKSIYKIPNLITTLEFKYVLFTLFTSILILLLPTLLISLIYFYKKPIKLIYNYKNSDNNKIIKKIKGKLNKISFLNKNKINIIQTIILTVILSLTILFVLSYKTKINSPIKHFYKINKYDLKIDVKKNGNPSEITSLLDKEKSVNSYVSLKEDYVYLYKNKKKTKVNTMVSSNLNTLNKFVKISDKKLNNKKIVISKKLAKKLNIKENDVIKIFKNKKKIKVKVHLTSNDYNENYIYIPNDMYEKLTKNKTSYNVILTKNNKQITKIKNKINSFRSVRKTYLSKEIKNEYVNSNHCLIYLLNVLITIVILSLIISIYVITMISVRLKYRDIYLMKINGSYDFEITNYVYKEIIITSVLSALFTCLLLMFKTRIINVLLTMLMVLISLLIVGLLIHIKLKKLDMIKLFSIE